MEQMNLQGNHLSTVIYLCQKDSKLIYIQDDSLKELQQKNHSAV